MTLKELYNVAPCAFIFIRRENGTVEEYKGGSAEANRAVEKVTPTSYPMFKQVLEVNLAPAKTQVAEDLYRHRLATTKVRDFIKIEQDIDVYDDVCEELGICFCGPMTLTQEGEEHFAEVMDYDVETDGDVAVVHVDDPDEHVWHHKLYKAKEFFDAAAGYCSEDQYNAWFKQDECE